MKRVKYFACYTGPSYGSADQTNVDAFRSLYGAMKSMWNRQYDGYDDVLAYHEAEDGFYRRDFRGGTGYVRFPATTPQDVMDVYYAVWDNEEEGYILGDWAYRVYVGPRGGIRAEKA